MIPAVAPERLPMDSDISFMQLSAHESSSVSLQCKSSTPHVFYIVQSLLLRTLTLESVGNAECVMQTKTLISNEPTEADG